MLLPMEVMLSLKAPSCSTTSFSSTAMRSMRETMRVMPAVRSELEPVSRVSLSKTALILS